MYLRIGTKNNRFPVVDMKGTGDNIKQMLRENELSIPECQHILGLNSPNSIYKWFRGDSVPSIDNLIMLARMFNTKIDDILVVK